MANFNQLTKIVTPEGTAVYPHIRTTEVFEGNDSGKYTCGIKLNKEDTEKLMARIEKEWQSAVATEFEGKRFGRNTQPALGFREDKNGDIVFKAKTNAVIKTKAGDVFEKDVTVFDKYGKPMDRDIEIGNGSTIRLCMLLRPFYGSSSVYGVQLILQAVQVLNLVQAGGSSITAEECGFSVVKEEEMGIPFDDNATADF